MWWTRTSPWHLRYARRWLLMALCAEAFRAPLNSHTAYGSDFFFLSFFLALISLNYSRYDKTRVASTWCSQWRAGEIATWAMIGNMLMEEMSQSHPAQTTPAGWSWLVSGVNQCSWAVSCQEQNMLTLCGLRSVRGNHCGRCEEVLEWLGWVAPSDFTCKLVWTCQARELIATPKLPAQARTIVRCYLVYLGGTVHLHYDACGNFQQGRCEKRHRQVCWQREGLVEMTKHDKMKWTDHNRKPAQSQLNDGAQVW